jgi:UDP-2,3-diacylglucosamine pyrophosphatase LpxH
MDLKRITLIVSDLHMGDGNPGDDFVDDKHQFADFVRGQATTPEGGAGQIELIINGDFLEFVQVCPQAYSLNSPDYWCSEEESVAKLERILRGHVDVFEALKQFQRTGNRVTLFAGNHDVDLYWPEVQARIRERAGEVNIELGCVWYTRYGGRLRISHGHLFPSLDPANGFKEWRDPRLKQKDDKQLPRLEMCPGTLFVVRFVNPLEDKYPFADNLHPETALASILWREDAWGLKAVAWMLTRFAAQFPKTILSASTRVDIGPHLLDAVKFDPSLREGIASLYRELLQAPDMTSAEVARRLKSEDAVAAFVERLLRTDASWEKSVAVFNRAKPGVLSAGTADSGTLTIREASRIDVKKECVTIAEAAWRDHAQVVVFGHTHLPQKLEGVSGRYYNPGSWTRYVDADALDSLTLEDLKCEDSFPYELNYVRIEDTGSDSLLSELIRIERRPDG